MARKNKPSFYSSAYLVLLSTNVLAESFNLEQIQFESIKTEDIKVTAVRENLIGIADTASEGVISNHRISNIPHSRPGEVLEQVPGLIVSQHSGDGKANQYYLRGFNLDHGTDFAVWLDGMPLNMPTHAHGQGYIDSNWLMPELIDSLEFKKGAYHAEQGDFSAAGSTHLHYAKTLPQSIAKLTLGSYGFQRLFNAGSQGITDGQFLYAVEAQGYDGAWDNSQNLKKFNGLLRYSTGTEEHGWNITAMGYNSKWDATDQVPKRAINAGLINRFGAIDTSDGGETSRYSLSADWHDGVWQANAYAIHYKLDLFSNFTYFLDDSINGDQFEQADKRNVFGGAVIRSFNANIADLETSHQIGLQGRYDDIGNVGLYRTVARQRLSTTREDAVKQGSVGLWWQGNWQILPNLRASTGLREDIYKFDIDSNIAENSGKAHSNIFSPKLGLAWQASKQHEFYVNWGRGFHSNDARGSTIRVDPVSGDAAEKVNPLVKAISKELGWRANPIGNWQTTLALFQLDIDSELLFIGDAGATEASRPSRRVGVEWTNYIPINSWSYIDADFAIARARFKDSDEVGDYIPGSIAKTASIGIAINHPSGWSASTRLRYFGPRALIEDNSVRSNSSLLTNARIGYQISSKINLSLDIFNLFNRKVSDIDYLYTSRLKGEAADGVKDIHTHPVEPRMARLSLSLDY
ncbi:MULTISPECIES: TonB-dependent receptor [Methylotenera]|uniref:TonB-dependent receptor n=1 Tax=Methylotenera TaxID=359407 RepID=UPI000363FD79|nr:MULTISPECIES: TonB-dependent receptor [Methylotenera]